MSVSKNTGLFLITKKINMQINDGSTNNEAYSLVLFHFFKILKYLIYPKAFEGLTNWTHIKILP